MPCFRKNSCDKQNITLSSYRPTPVVFFSGKDREFNMGSRILFLHTVLLNMDGNYVVPDVYDKYKG